LVRYYRHGFKSQHEKREKSGSDRGRHDVAAGQMYFITDEDLSGPVGAAAAVLAGDRDKIHAFDEAIDPQGDEDIWEEKDTSLDRPTIKDLEDGALSLETEFQDVSKNPNQIAHDRALAIPCTGGSPFLARALSIVAAKSPLSLVT
jgi:hypothetical protein